MRRLPVALALALLLTVPLEAQTLRAGAVAAAARVTTPFSSGEPTLTGALAGGVGEVDLGVLALAGTYLQGRVTGTNNIAWDVVEGDAVLAVRPAPWVSIGFGPHARSYLTGAGTVRWVLWSARAGVALPLATDAMRATFDLWAALAGSVDGTTPYGSARGLTGGLSVRIPRTRLWALGTYRAEHLALSGGAGVETYEEIGVGVGLAF
ncbi:MAG TPA: hypothetical protein VJ992_14495 [Gemmatimonadales bacterium]|nr:hypothetical protein [Gemmatimonadales bacterium]